MFSLLLSPANRAFMLFGVYRLWHDRVVLALQIVMYLLLIVIFGSIFFVTPFHELFGHPKINAYTMIWYLTITEIVTFVGGGYNFHDVRSDVLGGNFSTSLQRPQSYLMMKLSSWVGAHLVCIPVYMVCGFSLAFIFTGEVPYSLLQLIFLFVSTYLACLMYSVIYFMIGAIEVWGPYGRQALWINQKCIFILGGLILPLQLYPEWLQTIVWFLPYPAILNIPGKIAFDPTLLVMMQGVLIQLAWLLVILGAGFYVLYRAYQKILRGEA